jgi:hypothetical protein
MNADLFTEEPPEADSEPGADRRCTPEKLLAFVSETKARAGRSPTLAECKERFGGLLGVFVDSWQLKKAGLL